MTQFNGALAPSDLSDYNPVGLASQTGARMGLPYEPLRTPKIHTPLRALHSFRYLSNDDMF